MIVLFCSLIVSLILQSHFLSHSFISLLTSCLIYIFFSPVVYVLTELLRGVGGAYIFFQSGFLLPSHPSLSYFSFLFGCHTHLFVRFKFNVNNSIKNSLLYSISESSLFSFLPSVFRPLCLVLRASFVCGGEDPMPHAREGVERVKLGLVQLVGGSGLCSSSAAVQNALLQGLLSIFTDVSLSFWRREDMGLCPAWFGLFLQFKEVITSLFFFLLIYLFIFFGPRRPAPGTSLAKSYLLPASVSIFSQRMEKKGNLRTSAMVSLIQRGNFTSGSSSPHSHSLHTLNTHTHARTHTYIYTRTRTQTLARSLSPSPSLSLFLTISPHLMLSIGSCYCGKKTI